MKNEEQSSSCHALDIMWHVQFECKFSVVNSLFRIFAGTFNPLIGLVVMILLTVEDLDNHSSDIDYFTNVRKLLEKPIVGEYLLGNLDDIVGDPMIYFTNELTKNLIVAHVVDDRACIRGYEHKDAVSDDEVLQNYYASEFSSKFDLESSLLCAPPNIVQLVHNAALLDTFHM